MVSKVESRKFVPFRLFNFLAVFNGILKNGSLKTFKNSVHTFRPGEFVFQVFFLLLYVRGSSETCLVPLSSRTIQLYRSLVLGMLIVPGGISNKVK